MRTGRPNRLAVTCAAGLLTLWALPAFAQQSQNWTWCVNRNHAFALDVAIKGCTAVIQSGRETRRNTAIAFNNRGIAYFSHEENEHAIADFSEAIKLDPRYADAFQSRATAYSDNGDHDHAIADYNASIRLNQKNPIAFNNRCDELLVIHQVQAALSDCNESLRQRPNHFNTLMHRGNAYLAAGQLDKALADYEIVLRHNPKDAWALYGRGYARLKQGDAPAGNAEMAAAKAIEAGIAAAFETRGIK